MPTLNVVAIGQAGIPRFAAKRARRVARALSRWTGVSEDSALALVGAGLFVAAIISLVRTGYAMLAAARSGAAPADLAQSGGSLQA